MIQRQKIKSIVEDSDTKLGKTFDIAIQILIVLSIITFSIETLPNLKPETRQSLRIFEIVAVAIFTIEYFMRILVADKKSTFIFSFFGIVDLMAILPFYLSIGIDLRSVRAIRLLRLFRLLKLARYNRAVRRYHRTFAMAKEELALCLAMAGILLYLSAVGIYYFERDSQPEEFASVFHSLWWAIITLTTVGYGDTIPITVGGRVFTFMILIIGLGFISIPTGIFASALSKAREMDE